MSAATVPVQQATIRQYAKRLQLARRLQGQFVPMAEQAIKEKQGHLNYLEVLLGMEVEERERNTVARRIKEAHFPKVKTLEGFAFCDVPHIPVALVRNLAEGGYLQRSEPIIFLGEAGTGKTHLATGLAVEACRQRKRVRFTTAAEMVNELIEAKNNNELNRVTQRWTRYELIVIDELAYVAMPETAAELLFQIIAGRAERAAVIVTTNLPFSEWTTMFPNARLCKAMLDRLTDQAHIIETGTESYRFRRTLENRKGGKGTNDYGREQWYRAHLRWAVMVEGKEGLRGWKESVYLFLSEDHDTAFRRALEIGRGHQDEHQEGRRWVETRLAYIVTLDNLGSNPTEFEVNLGTKKPGEHLPFEHVFDPEGATPPPMF